MWDPTRRDGAGQYGDNYGAEQNYIDEPPKPMPTVHTNVSSLNWMGDARSYVSTHTDDDYAQPKEFWEKYLKNLPESSAAPAHLPDGLKKELEKVPDLHWNTFSVAQKNFVYNVAADLYGAKDGRGMIWDTAFSQSRSMDTQAKTETDLFPEHFKAINKSLAVAVEKATRYISANQGFVAFTNTMTDRKTGPVPVPAPSVTHYDFPTPAKESEGTDA